MKKLFLFIGLFFALHVSAQSAYERGRNRAFTLWKQGKNTEAVNLFERISKVEKDNWLPSFYAGYISILSSFNIKDEATLTTKLDKANAFLDTASKISPYNPEIMIAQALHNTAYINFDGQKYGMTMSTKNSAIYEKALKIAPKNPRVILSKAEWDMGAARFFGKPLDPYCKDVHKAIELFKTEKQTLKYAPKWGKERAEQILKQCGKNN